MFLPVNAFINLAVVYRDRAGDASWVMSLLWNSPEKSPVLRNERKIVRKSWLPDGFSWLNDPWFLHNQHLQGKCVIYCGCVHYLYSKSHTIHHIRRVIVYYYPSVNFNAVKNFNAIVIKCTWCSRSGSLFPAIHIKKFTLRSADAHCHERTFQLFINTRPDILEDFE